MLNNENIQAIINNPEKEHATTELKSFRKIFDENHKSNGEKRRDIACEIVALANRYGGKLIFGLNDDGTFDGKGIYNIDKTKEIIQQECLHNISPPIDTSTQFLQCVGGDLLIIDVPKRKTIPHAYIVSREGGLIKNRIYYIRTSHGKQLVSDNQLEWLFTNKEDPNFFAEFRIAIDLNKQLDVIGKNFNRGMFSISDFLNRLSPNEIAPINNGGEKFYTCLIELFPFFILKSISDYYSNSWYIGIHKGFDRVSSGVTITNPPTPTVPVDISEIPLSGVTIINNLSWNLKDVLKAIFPKKIHIPPSTDISIIYESDGKAADIILKNPSFNFKISIDMLDAGGGLNQHNPEYQGMLEKNPLQAHNYSINNFYHFSASGKFAATFEFPEYDVEEFKKHYHYSNTLKNLITDFWD